MLNVIDIGSSNTRSYLIDKDGIVNLYHRDTKPDRIVYNALDAFRRCGLGHSSATIVLSSSDSVVWESMDGEYRWVNHSDPDHWEEGLPPYEYSGHPRYDMLRGAGNQMLWLKREVGLENIKRMLPLSAMVASVIANDATWNAWDYTHASNSGMYNFRTGGWADEMQPFIDAGIISKNIFNPNFHIPSDPSLRTVYLGGHDSVFTCATDIPYSTRPYISCGTWTTVSTGALQRGDPPIDKDKDNRDRYVLAPNGSALRQRCFYSEPEEQDTALQTIVDFLNSYYENVVSVPVIKVFGTWSGEIIERLYKWETRYQFEWIPPDERWGCIHLPQKALAYVQQDPHFRDDPEYFCEGA